MKQAKQRILAVTVVLLLATAVVSLTLGRELLSGRSPGLGSFSIIHFAGYLFFITMPVEVLVPYYQAEGHPGTLLVLIAVGTAIVAQTIDYGIGKSFSQRFIDTIIGKRRHQRAQRAVDRHGSWAIVIFNLLPLSSPILLLVAGMVRFRLSRALPYSLIGLTGKYVAIVYFFGGFG